MSQPITDQGGDLVFFYWSEKHKLGRDVEILLPVKFP